MSRTDLNPGSLWRSLETGTSAERKLVCSNNWDRAPPQSTVENNSWMDYPGPLSHHQPQSLAITSPDAMLKEDGEEELDSRYPKDTVLTWGRDALYTRRKGVLTMQ